MEVLFTKQGCQKCEYVKERLQDKSYIKDIETPEGLALLAYLSQVTNATKTMPILVYYEVGENLMPIITKVSTSVIETKNLCEGEDLCKM